MSITININDCFFLQSDSHDINETSTDTIQFVNIRVKPTRPGVTEFIIRINALEFKSLQDRMLRPITILDGVTFSKTVIDRFVEVFKQQIESNPRYKTSEVKNHLEWVECSMVIQLRVFFCSLPGDGLMFRVHAG